RGRFEARELLDIGAGDEALLCRADDEAFRIGPANLLQGALNCSSASRENVFADSPCLSKVSQASPSRSVSQCQCFVSLARSMSSPLTALRPASPRRGRRRYRSMPCLASSPCV